MIPDYHVEQERLIVDPRLEKDQIKEDEHPLDTMAKAMRVKNDVYAQLQPNQVLLTNLPEKYD